MNRLTTGIVATTLAASFAAAAFVPANAAMVYTPQPQNVTSDIQTVDYKPWMRRDMRRDMNRRGDSMYWNGHRGYRDYRPGYRRHGDFWFPLAAFTAGALITGAIVNQAAPPVSGNSHVQWCYDRYKSYRAWDNTYQPYNGPRRECVSPY